ncbi:MAG: hypothetical protein JWM16_4231 [Verrucomicrobiales bacterium]|nr:hypothetical protein [Verrucomicrobiales bacterium]
MSSRRLSDPFLGKRAGLEMEHAVEKFGSNRPGIGQGEGAGGRVGRGDRGPNRVTTCWSACPVKAWKAPEYMAEFVEGRPSGAVRLNLFRDTRELASLCSKVRM